MAAAPLPRNRRLSWQLWASHLAVVVITLVALVGAIVLLATIWLLRQGSVLREPALDAQLISVTVGNLLRRGVPESAVSAVLVDLRNGGVRLPFGPLELEHGPRWGGPFAGVRPNLQDLDYVVALSPDNKVLASSDRGRFPPGGGFPPAGQSEVGELVRRALAGERDPARLSFQPPNSSYAVGAYPIVDSSSGATIGALALAKQSTLPRDVPSLLRRSLAAFGLATTVVLAASSVFALAFSAVAAYLLSRRLGDRIDRLSRAADAVARGDLSQRVPADEPDELGRLSERFNLMAQRLEQSIAAIEVEKERAESALHRQRELVATVSHELRTPLATIRGHVESLGMTDNADQTQRSHYLEVIDRETERLKQVVDDLFSLATAEAGALPLNIEALALKEVAGEVSDSLAPLARAERRVTLVNSIGDAPSVYADRQRLTQVLTNLLRNAVRHTPEGGLVSLSAVPVDGRVEVEVADTGTGIPPDELPHVFERFYRGGPARDRASGGAGLGLAIVREFVEAMGGEVSVESTVGEGSRFRFALPLARSSGAANIVP